MIYKLINRFKGKKATAKERKEPTIKIPVPTAEMVAIEEVCDILKWHKKTFPTFTYQEQKEKLAGEIREFQAALEEYIRTANPVIGKAVHFELADVVIAGINLMRYEEMRELVKEKMEINYTRTWKGGQHKE